MPARIYQRPKNAMQSGKALTDQWILEFAPAELSDIGHNVMGVERLINARLGVTRKDDTLPRRWFEEAIGVGPFKGEKIDRREFDDMLSRFYVISNLTEEGLPREEWRAELEGVLAS